ncbi:MAG: hypothetical protein K2F88_04885 [Duncaniella sp.]|nr:hypothetical protein [Duncaniella sp.]
MRIISLIALSLWCSIYAEAQLNIRPQNNGVKEYTVQNAMPYDSLANVDSRTFASLPGQTLYMHGAMDDRGGYHEVFFTGNFFDDEQHPVYKVDGIKVTPATAGVGKYYDVLKVWTKMTRCCILLREKESGDEIYYNPNVYRYCMTCLGFYEKLKRHIGQKFLSLSKKVETESGDTMRPAEGAEFRCVDIGLKMNSMGAFLIMESTDGIRVEANPMDDEVYEFVSENRISMLEKQYGTDFGRQIAFRKVSPGMTKEMVITAWGEPYRKSEFQTNDKLTESWSFSDNRYVEIQDGKVTNVRIYKKGWY